MRVAVMSVFIGVALMLAGCGQSKQVSDAQKDANSKAYFKSNYQPAKHQSWSIKGPAKSEGDCSSGDCQKQ